MRKELLVRAVDLLMTPPEPSVLKDQSSSPSLFKKVNDRGTAYSGRHRGQWFSPEYDFGEIQFAQDANSYLFRAIKKKVDRFLTAGWEFVGENKESVDYIRERIRHIELATDRPFGLQMVDTIHDLTRYSNCMWSKVRDRERSPGLTRKVNTSDGARDLDPVAGYFTLPFETLQLKTKPNGELKKVKQIIPGIDQPKEFAPTDVIHFYANKKPGFAVGTPEMFPALDDLSLLGRIEELVEELIESALFPVFHYRIGTQDAPERHGANGKPESETVRETIEYMPAGSIYISDYRHEITPLGAEGKALRVDFYLEYFKKRAFSAIGTTAVDMGEGTGATKSTASTMSKSMMLDVEALQQTIKIFIDHYVIGELLIEGGYDPLDESNKVEVRFGVIDKEDRRADENQQIQLFANKGTTQTEMRRNLGYKPMTEEDQDDTYYKLYEEPLSMVKGMGPGSTASETLAQVPTSHVTPETVNKEKQFAKQIEKLGKAGQPGARPKAASSGARRASTAKAKSPKTTRDFFPADATEAQIDSVLELARDYHSKLANKDILFDTVVESLAWRLFNE